MKLVAFGALGAACALIPALAMWSFTVDDALISIRYAANVAQGIGWRFDPGAPPSDGVTPLPWVVLLAPLAHGDPLDVLVRAKAVGIASWTAAGAALGVHLAKRGPAVLAALALAVMALAFPIGAWAASGMETGVVTALVTLAAVSIERPRHAAVLAGVAAAFRPELLPWALVVAAGASETAVRRLSNAAIAIAPFAACVVVRLVAFGSPAPLAVAAKPSDPAHGALYAAAAAVVLLVPLLAFAPVSIARSTRGVRTLALSGLVHLVAVAAAGGDWMPYARLVVPIAPSLAIVFVDAAARGRRVVVAVRAAIAVALGVFLAVRAAPAGRGVQRDRDALVRDARPMLADAHVVAALDVGWVSAAVPDGVCIVDLAGLTDPAIALLPGGHTSKRVDTAMLLDRGVDTVIVYSEARVVELRIVRTTLFRERFEQRGSIALGSRGAGYDVWKLR